MYNNETVTQFGSAETKLKQLHIKLKEAEVQQAQMKQESEVLRQNLQMLQNMVPEEISQKISDLLLAMAKDALDNMDEHLELRQKHNLGQIAALDQRERFVDNLRRTLEKIKRGDEYYRFMHLRTISQKEKQAEANRQPTKNVVDEDEIEEDDQPDEEELELIKKESMSGLFMSFKIAGPKDPKKKPPKLPARDGYISEDSMEDMISNDLDESRTNERHDL